MQRTIFSKGTSLRRIRPKAFDANTHHRQSSCSSFNLTAARSLSSSSIRTIRDVSFPSASRRRSDGGPFPLFSCRSSAATFSSAAEPLLDDDEDNNISDSGKDLSSGELLHKYNLGQWYYHQHNMSTRNAFETHGIFLSPREVWTATFVCPIHGDRYDCAKMEGAIEHEGKYYYTTKKIAKQAAALEANTRLNNVKQYHGLSSGSSSTQDGEEESTITALDQQGELEQEENTSPDKEEVDLDGIWRELHTYYQREHSVSVPKKSVITTMASLKGSRQGGDWWTASFVCPLSAERHDSGTMVGFDGQVFSAKGLIWYRRKDEAISAAAGRALDSLYSRDDPTLVARFCEENGVIEDENDDEEPIDLVAPSMVEDLQDLTQEDDEQNQEDIPEESQINNDSTTTQQEEEDEGEFVIQHVPVLPTPTDLETGGASPLDILVDAWIDEPVVYEALQQDQPGPFSNERQRSIDAAMGWLNQQKREEVNHHGEKVFFDNNHDLTSFARIGKMMLNSLAYANQTTIPTESELGKVEEAARAVIDSLWQFDSTRPDAEVYAIFMKCLEGSNPLDVAKRCRAMYDAMLSGSTYESRILPSPTTAVFNSLVQTWALVGGKTGRLDLDLDHNVTPDRETFLSHLSSMAYPPTIEGEHRSFDIQYARDIIQKMQERHAESGDSSLILDTQVLNSALRWSGGVMSVSKTSRPFQRNIPPDNYAALFEGDPDSPMDGPLFDEALELSLWVDEMEKLGVSSDLETRECLMQAWLRSGSVKGINRAEEIALSLLAQNDLAETVQTETFYPILSAWIHSGSMEGPERCQSWVERLESRSASSIDESIRWAPFAAHLGRQQRIISRLESTSNEQEQEMQKSLDAVLESAEAVTKAIQASSLVRGSRDLWGEQFSSGVKAWCNVGKARCISGTNQILSNEFSRILGLLQDFESLVVKEISAVDQQHSRPTVNLLQSMNMVYMEVISAMNELDCLQEKAGGSTSAESDQSLVISSVYCLEEILRRSEESRVLLTELSKQNIIEAEPNTDAAPRFSSFLNPPSSSIAPIDRLLIPNQVLSMLIDRYIEGQDDNGIINILFLIKSIANSENEKDGSLDHDMLNLYTNMVKLIQKLGLGVFERDEMLRLLAKDISRKDFDRERISGLLQAIDRSTSTSPEPSDPESNKKDNARSRSSSSPSGTSRVRRRRRRSASRGTQQSADSKSQNQNNTGNATFRKMGQRARNQAHS